MNAFAQEYLIKYCPKDAAPGTAFYNRIFSLDNMTDLALRYVIFYAPSKKFWLDC